MHFAYFFNAGLQRTYNYINSDLIESNDKKNLRFKGKRRNKNEVLEAIAKFEKMVNSQEDKAKEAKKLMKEKNLVTTK
jgi:hypothetical protein